MKRHVPPSLRAAQAPITSLDIARTFIEGRGLDHDCMVVIRKRVGACLWKLRDSGAAFRVPLEGEYKGWRLA